MFAIGSTYTRDEIHALIGGGKRASLLQSGGDVVGICYVGEMNPGAPRSILVNRGARQERAAAQLAARASPVPVFVRRRPGAWEHLGGFRAERFVASAEGEAQAFEGSAREGVAGVLVMSPA
jgi:hypothetical protein